MSKTVLMAHGVFSKLTIELNDGVHDKLAMTDARNSLKEVREEMEAILNKFEKLYFDDETLMTRKSHDRP